MANIAVDVDKLKKSNNAGEPGVEKENVKFLFGLLEQACLKYLSTALPDRLTLTGFK